MFTVQVDNLLQFYDWLLFPRKVQIYGQTWINKSYKQVNSFKGHCHAYTHGLYINGISSLEMI